MKEEKRKVEQKYVLVKELPKRLASGAVKGIGVAGVINTAFPDLIPVFSAMYTGASNLSLGQKLLIGVGLSSAPSLQISNLAILGVGAIVGALTGGTIALVKSAQEKSKGKRISK